ncbi:MAG: DUF58 domain-containing protein [Opitutales bacterium]
MKEGKIDQMSGVYRSVLAESKRVAAAWKLGALSPHPSQRMGAYMTSRAGSSAEFLDQRPFSRGDDIRHINWQAFARTEQVMINLFQQESAPILDIIIDCSESMSFQEDKWKGAWKLWAFLMNLSQDSGSRVRAFLVCGSEWVEVPSEDPEAGFVFLINADPGAPSGVLKVPFTPKSFRVFISDLLFEELSQEIPACFARGSGGFSMVAPFVSEEASPAWAGNIEFHDVENGQKLTHLCDTAFIQRYQNRYKAHFNAWDEAIQKQGGTLSRVDSKMPLSKAISASLARCGMVVPR